jgi:hypothetical protein
LYIGDRLAIINFSRREGNGSEEDSERQKGFGR